MTNENESIYWLDQEALNKVFLGRKIVKAEMFPNEANKPLSDDESGGWLTLNDGTKIEIRGLDGGCACRNGCYTITQLNTFDNIIVKVETVDLGDDCGEPGDVVLRVYAAGYISSPDDGQTVVYSQGGDNGYYGSGFSLYVRRLEISEVTP